MLLNLLIKGLASRIPGIYKLSPRSPTGGTDSATYCYEIWLKHLTMLWESGLRAIPDSIAELGPGDSIGLGLAALLSGINKYHALDVVNYINTERNLLIFDQLVKLFKKREGRPSRGWPDYDRYLDAHLFPSHILTEKVLDSALSLERIQSIRNALLNNGSGNGEVSIKYISPWNDPQVIAEGSVDLIISHSVLEHVNELESAYRAFLSWLKPNGVMSHQIDFSSHGMSEEWNGHWAYSPLLWSMIVGKRPNMINRQPCSAHISLMKSNGFKITCLLKNNKGGGIERSRLSSYWRSISEDDFRCSGMFVQAKKIVTGK